MPNILMLAYFDIFGSGGMPTSAQRILRLLSEKGWSGTVICEASESNYKKFRRFHNFDIKYVFPITDPWIPFKKPYLIFKYWLKNLCRMLLTIDTVNRTNARIVFVWGPPNFPQTGVFGIFPFWILLKKLKMLIVVVRVCGGGSTWIHKHNPIISDLFFLEECAQIKFSDKFVCIEHFLRDHYPKKYSDKCVTITNSVDTAVFRPIEYPDNKIVMYVGRLTVERGIWTFLEAVNILKQKNKPYRFVVVGSGHLEFECKKFVKEHNLNVEFWGDIPHSEMPKIYNQATVVINPTYAEGIGNITLEAMACGKPVIRTKSRLKDYLIIDGHNGYLFRDANELAEKIELVIENPVLRKVIEKNARQTIVETYGEDAEKEKYDRLLMSLT